MTTKFDHKRFETKLRARLEELAPPAGTEMTPELRKRVEETLFDMVDEELGTSGADDLTRRLVMSLVRGMVRFR